MNKLSLFFFIIGLIFLLIALFIGTHTFYPIVYQEVKYSLKKNTQTKPIIPVNTDFGIVIPKIEANSKVISNVNPNNEKEYQLALSKGVAHAKGTGFPGHAGNTFIFAHSSENWFIANRYNSVFYLLYKLEKGDQIDLYYQSKKYIYKVIDKKYVEPSEINYMNDYKNTSILTLMTCWPPGTTLKRLIIISEISI